LTDEEYQIFFNYIWEFEKYKINSLRMQLLCNIAYTSGLRLSEILSLKIEDIRKSETRITWKGNKTRWVFFTWSSQSILESYLEEREKPTPRTWKTVIQSDFIFTSLNIGKYSWKPMKKNTVCERIKKYSDELNIWKRITVHSLRHSYATRLLENGLNIREIQELLWHCDIQTTETYTHVLKSNLKNKVNQIFI
jgi:site-specific recombinase XerD